MGTCGRGGGLVSVVVLGASACHSVFSLTPPPDAAPLECMQVAELLGISEAATLQRLARGREYLAKGVTALVEKSLRGQRTRRNLVAGVLAALPVAVPSPVD